LDVFIERAANKLAKRDAFFLGQPFKHCQERLGDGNGFAQHWGGMITAQMLR
jgi:hypothetical protein